MFWSKFDGWWIFLSAFLILSIVAAIIFSHWTIYAMIGLILAIAVVAWYHTSPSYKIDSYGIRFIFLSEEEIPEKEELELFIWKEVITKFAQSGVLLSKDILKGIDVYVNAPDPKKNIFGRTWPNAKYTEIWPRKEHGLLDPGVLGYELSLHICHHLFPNRPEKYDIEWMVEKGIIE